MLTAAVDAILCAEVVGLIEDCEGVVEQESPREVYLSGGDSGAGGGC